MWISADGKCKVEQTEVTCRDPRFGDITIPRYVAHQWSEENGRWMPLVATNNINILASRVDLAELIEFPSPDWEDEAMQFNGG